ncbi:hypothetical protein AWM70_16845 [Paenibacillus yonginensis]|uniref:Uncharacterized protein n=1 Tax=Paenibacillus yonginensis TaxID=1462996 RepID=A0A1B1N3Q4_9BACL|nr:hypothetical protein [Paenibacillus yonginensis]ANS76042.1 hypothetical protein AWM70_16845 [Paenibacillus yonginensis]
MLAAIKEIKNFVTGVRGEMKVAGDEEYRRIEFGTERLLHTPQSPNSLTPMEESRIKQVIYH